MRVLVYAAFVAVLTILAGCHGKQEYEIIYLTEDVARRDLVGKVVEIPDLDVPSMVYYRDSSLYFIDYKSMESQLYVYDFRDHSTSGFIRRGRGPGEMLGAYSAAFVCDGGQEKMVVYDIAQGDMLQADVNSLKSDGYCPEQHYGKFSIFMKVWSITGYGDKVLGLGNFDDARVIEFFGEDSLKVVSDYLPNLRESSAQVMEFNFDIHWNNGRFKFVDVSLDDLLDFVKYEYGLDIDIDETVDRNALLTGSFLHNEGEDGILSKIVLSLNLNCKKENGKYVLSKKDE